MPDWLNDAPRTPLAHLPTPLHPLDRLSEHLGGSRIWVKRDDCTGLGTGGNKTRKLEFLLGEALEERAEVVITFGAVQSNHARQTAAACATLGLPCHLLLARKVPWRDPNYETLGNVLLDELFGATIHLLDEAALRDRFRELRAELSNKRICVIPTGGSNATGATGYAACTAELIEQAAAIDLKLSDIVHATSSAGTQSGLLAGFAHHELPVRVRGINVSDPDPAPLIDTIGVLAAEILTRHDQGRELADDAVRVDSSYIGDGYGMPTELTLEAVRTTAELEGLLLDPVYSGKAMGGLMDGIRAGQFDEVSNIVFLHTGGTASLPVYGSVLGNS